MFDIDWKPFVIECNAAPFMDLKTDATRYVTKTYTKSTMDLMTFFQENRENANELILQ